MSTTLEIYQAGTELLIVVRGRIVLEDLSRLKQTILPRIVRGIENVYVDLFRVEYVDSAGLGLLIGLKMQSKSQGAAITLLDPNKIVSDVLTISRVDGIFEVLRGQESSAVRERLALDTNLLRTEDSAVAAGGDLAAGAHLPYVSADGNLNVESDDDSGHREAVEEHCRNAVEALRQGNYEESINCYRSALELDPNYLPALNNLAIVYEKQPNWHSQAVETWQRVLDVSRQRNDAKHIDRAQRHLTDLREQIKP